MRPEIKFARSGDLHIAYRTRGEGPLDLIFVPNWIADVEFWGDVPVLGTYVERLASFSRLMTFDQPGTGLSDSVGLDQLPTLEVFADSIRCVMDAEGIERAALIGWAMAALPCVMFATTYPERTSALVMQGPTARFTADGDYPGVPEGEVEQWVETNVAMRGTPDLTRFAFPSMASDEAAVDAWNRAAKQSLSPGMFRAAFHMTARLDVRQLLPLVACPTLVLYTSGNPFVPLEQVRYIADRIPDARLAIHESPDVLPCTEPVFEAWMSDIQEFLTGEAPAPKVDDRVLATVLFTDIVGSTPKLAAGGDSHWTAVLDQHDALLRRHVERFRGRYVENTGDGMLATFDGPARAVRCAQAICEGVRSLGIEVRAGLHTGEVELRGANIGGIAVHIGQRVSAVAQAGEVLVSRTVTDLVAGSGLEFEDRGEHQLKGVPNRWQLFAVRH